MGPGGLGSVKNLKSRDGSIGRVARQGMAMGSGGTGGGGSVAGGSGARSDRYGSAVSKSGERAEAEDGLEDSRD